MRNIKNTLQDQSDVEEEKNHKTIYTGLFEGRTLGNYICETAILSADHISSTVQASLNGWTPFKLAWLQNSLIRVFTYKFQNPFFSSFGKEPS